MVRAAFFLLPLVLLDLVSSLALAESSTKALWRCGENTFTNRAIRDDRDSTCEPFFGSRVCGSGANRYFTPSRAGLSDQSDCKFVGLAASPFVHQADLETLEFDAGSHIRNFERRLKSYDSFAIPDESLHQEFLRELDVLKSFVRDIPGAERIIDSLASSQDQVFP